MAPAVPFALEKAFSGNSSSSSSVHRSDSSTSGDEDDITAGRVVQKKRAPPAIPPPPPTPVPEKPTLVRRSTSGGGTALPAPVIFREKSGSKASCSVPPRFTIVVALPSHRWLSQYPLTTIFCYRLVKTRCNNNVRRSNLL